MSLNRMNHDFRLPMRLYNFAYLSSANIHTHAHLWYAFDLLISILVIVSKTHSARDLNWRRIKMTFVLNSKKIPIRACASQSRFEQISSSPKIALEFHHRIISIGRWKSIGPWRLAKTTWGFTGQSRNSFADRIVRIDSGQVIANSMTNRRSTSQTSERKLFFPFIRLVAKRSLIAPFLIWLFFAIAKWKNERKIKKMKSM